MNPDLTWRFSVARPEKRPRSRAGQRPTEMAGYGWLKTGTFSVTSSMSWSVWHMQTSLKSVGLHSPYHRINHVMLFFHVLSPFTNFLPFHLGYLLCIRTLVIIDANFHTSLVANSWIPKTGGCWQSVHFLFIFFQAIRPRLYYILILLTIREKEREQIRQSFT